jgi:hypothetical protein
VISQHLYIWCGLGVLVKRPQCIGLLAVVLTLNGCGLYTPNITEFYEAKTDEPPKVSAIIEHIECEIKYAVQASVIKDYNTKEYDDIREPGVKHNRHLEWLDTYVAQITLNLTLDESSSVNAGLSLINPMPNAITNVDAIAKTSVSTAQNSTVGFAATVSSRATRKDTLSIFLNLSDFTAPKIIRGIRSVSTVVPPNLCDVQHKPFIEGDLKFQEWLDDVTLEAYADESYPTQLSNQELIGKKDVIQHEVTFVITYNGGVTPSWKFVRVSANQGNQSFLFAQRMNTQDVIITMGPPGRDGKLNLTAQNSLLASQFRDALQGN